MGKLTLPAKWNKKHNAFWEAADLHVTLVALGSLTGAQPAGSPVTLRPPVYLSTEGGGLEEPAVLSRYNFPPTYHREQEEPFSVRGKPATPYVNELIVFSTSLWEEGSLNITDLSSGRFPKMLKQYHQFQGHYLLWFLLKFTRSESAGARRSQLGRGHRGWLGGWAAGCLYSCQDTEYI